jgi:predicted DsbA family dithiol-disulfide isomerase
MFEEAGLPHAERLDLVPNSRRALALGELARDRGRLNVLHLRLFEAYWARGLDIGSDEVLMQEGLAAGLRADEIAAGLIADGYAERVTHETQQAISYGAGGVPAWVIDQRLLVPGAQPRKVFEQVMQRLGHAPVDGDRPQEHRQAPSPSS